MIDLTALKWILSAPRRNQTPLQSLPFPACGPLLSMISFGSQIGSDAGPR